MNMESYPPADEPTPEQELMLTPNEIRVLGCLMEKEVSTPEYYPLTINALTNACNQKSNRDPVMTLSNHEVEQTLESLRFSHKLVSLVHTAGSRAHKYKHTIPMRFAWSPEQRAILCELFVRGPQTPGELRGRASRLFPFDKIEAVDQVLEELKNNPHRPLVTQLPREPGRRESRYIHLLSGPPDLTAMETSSRSAPTIARVEDGATEALETEVKSLREDLTRLQQAFEELKLSLGE